ncbi:MAG: LegC family aminotransferase [Chloroflexi bacterium]|nr:LegC family aminotransferase [Chloroflexota bacterium]
MSTQFEPGALVATGAIPLCVPEIRGNEWRYVKECLDTAWVSSVGSYVDRFERDVAAYVGAKRSIAVVNGTGALHMALLVAGVEPDDEVLVSTLTFIAPVNAIRYANAWPVFIDAEPNYWQMNAQQVVDFVERECVWQQGTLRNKKTGRRVKAIVPVHILGHPVDMDLITAVARKYNLVVIEDATESLGAKYKGQMVGKLGNIACFSFNGNKIITTGGGGMIVTDNEAWADRAKYLTTQAKKDPLEYIHDEIGYNYRLTNVQAAIGCAQMELLDDYIARKRAIAQRYDEAFASLPAIALMREADWAYSIKWLYTVLADNKIDSRALLRELAEKKVQTRPLWQPIHLSKAYANCQAYYGDVAERLNCQALSLPCSVGIQDEEIATIISLIEAHLPLVDLAKY